MNGTSRRSPGHRDRAVARLRTITIGTTVAGMAAVGAFGGVAALSYSGGSTDATTAAVTATSTAGTTNSSSTAATLQATQAPTAAATAAATAPTTTTSVGNADATTGGS